MSNDPLHAPVQQLSATIRINMNSLMASACAWIAWTCWPDNPRNMGWLILAGMFALAALLTTITVIKIIVNIYLREKSVYEFTQQGQSPKTAELATDKKLEKAGMR